MFHLAVFATKISKCESNAKIERKIISMLSIFPKLTKYVELKDFKRFLRDFNSQSINAIHAHFTTLFPSAEVVIMSNNVCNESWFERKLLSISKDKILTCIGWEISTKTISEI